MHAAVIHILISSSEPKVKRLRELHIGAVVIPCRILGTGISLDCNVIFDRSK